MSPEKLNRDINKIQKLENGIYELRHQLITRYLYKGQGKYYLPDIENAPPIDIISGPHGQSINIFLDNYWGMNRRRLPKQKPEELFEIPYVLKEFWSSMRLEEMQNIIKNYNNIFTQLLSEADEGFITDHQYSLKMHFNEEQFQLEKSCFIQQNELLIYEQIRNDLSTFFNSLEL